MSHTYTSGPWMIVGALRDTSIRIVTDGPRHTEPIAEIKLHRCFIHELTSEPSEEYRNAQLIAAAPELFEALRELVDCTDPAVVERARNALAKAKGEL